MRRPKYPDPYRDSWLDRVLVAITDGLWVLALIAIVVLLAGMIVLVIRSMF